MYSLKEEILAVFLEGVYFPQFFLDIGYGIRSLLSYVHFTSSFLLLMNFSVKMDDKKIKVDITATNLKDVLQYCKPKEQLVLMRKFGLTTGQEVPLQRIGRSYNLTRERVRQIETQALMRFRRLIVGNQTYIDLLDEAKKILDQHGGILAEEDLVAKLVNKNKFIFSAQEIKLILVSDFDINYLKRNKLLFKGFYIENLFEDVLSQIALYVSNHFEKTQESADLYEFIAQVKKEFTKQYPDVTYFKNDMFYIQFFGLIRNVKVFDGKIGLATFTDVSPRTIKLKILFALRRINKPLHYQELPSKILEWFPDKAVKLNTVHNELVKNNQVFVNMGLGIYGLKEWGIAGGLVKDIIVRVFQANKRPMNVKEISKEVLKEKMVSANTVLLNLQKYKDMFERVDKGVYQLKA